MRLHTNLQINFSAHPRYRCVCVHHETSLTLSFALSLPLSVADLEGSEEVGKQVSLSHAPSDRLCFCLYLCSFPCMLLCFTLKAAKRLARHAVMRADQAKSSSLTEARITPPMMGMRHSHLPLEICFL